MFGARQSEQDKIRCQLSFNPRAHAGRDLEYSPSTHHPQCFNPRAHAGRDEGIIPNIFRVLVFQSTRPRGARHRWGESADTPTMFQSTRPRGARPQCRYCRLDIFKVSIHAPTRGATVETPIRKLLRSVSIHAPTRGATVILYL